MVKSSAKHRPTNITAHNRIFKNPKSAVDVFEPRTYCVTFRRESQSAAAENGIECRENSIGCRENSYGYRRIHCGGRSPPDSIDWQASISEKSTVHHNKNIDPSNPLSKIHHLSRLWNNGSKTLWSVIILFVQWEESINQLWHNSFRR